MKEKIYHIAETQDWLAAKEIGEYRAESLGIQGFIHCSTSDQVLQVANSIYTNRLDLVLLVIDPNKLDVDLQWESLSEGGELFPHIYGAVNLDAVLNAMPLKPDQNGRFQHIPIP
jgi:uncharacterized protein (DUF952 family)